MSGTRSVRTAGLAPGEDERPGSVGTAQAPRSVAFACQAIRHGGSMSVYVEDWLAGYGSPYLVVPDETGVGVSELVEDSGVLRAHAGAAPEMPRLAFVDGVRRVEA